ncbi:hypothetical protein DL96DRAFT_1635652 [Flagelloscypha sp. PMI_526]|nr:hypothetical protein DL96DRAFT_1635652 [Flagelloscypha sp. PMI_526]
MVARDVFIKIATSFLVASTYPPSRPPLLQRQSTIDPATIPAQCKSQCTDVANTLNDCAVSTDLTCGCSVTMKNKVQVCFNCLINLVPSLRADMETAENQFAAGCKAAGIDVGSFSGSSSTSSPSFPSTLSSSSKSTTASSTLGTSDSSSDPFSRNGGTFVSPNLPLSFIAALVGSGLWMICG